MASALLQTQSLLLPCSVGLDPYDLSHMSYPCPTLDHAPLVQPKGKEGERGRKQETDKSTIYIPNRMKLPSENY